MSQLIVYHDGKRCVIASDDRATHTDAASIEILRAFIAAPSKGAVVNRTEKL